MTGAQDLLENSMIQARDALRLNHAKLLNAREELEAVEEGHGLTPARRGYLMGVLERWDIERRWFLADGHGVVTLEDVCEAAGTTVEAVRAFYQDTLVLPFSFRAVYRALWESRFVRTECRICVGPGCEATKAVLPSEGGETWEGLARSDSLRVEGTDSFRRTETAGRNSEATPIDDREGAS